MTAAMMFLVVGLACELVAKFAFRANLIAGIVSLSASLLLFGTMPLGGTFLLNVSPASLLGAIVMSLNYIPGTVASMSGATPEETALLPD